MHKHARTHARIHTHTHTGADRHRYTQVQTHTHMYMGSILIVDGGLAATRCPAHLFPFLPASLMQVSLASGHHLAIVPQSTDCLCSCYGMCLFVERGARFWLFALLVLRYVFVERGVKFWCFALHVWQLCVCFWKEGPDFDILPCLCVMACVCL